MQITIDTDTMSVDELQFLLECLQQDIEQKGGAKAPPSIPTQNNNGQGLASIKFCYNGSDLKGKKTKGSKPYLAVLRKSSPLSKYSYEFIKLDPENDSIHLELPIGTILRGRTTLDGTQYYFKVLERGLSGGRIKDYEL